MRRIEETGEKEVKKKGEMEKGGEGRRNRRRKRRQKGRKDKV